MHLGDLLNKMAAKCGLQNDPDFVAILSSADVANFEVADSLANGMDAALMSLTGAKNNPEVQKHFRAEALNAVDALLAPLSQKYGFSDAFNAEKNTYKRIEMLDKAAAQAIADAESKALKATSTDEVEKYRKAIAALESDLANAAKTKEAELADLRNQSARRELDMLVNFNLQGQKYANAALGATNITIARTLLDEALAKEGAVLTNENGTISIKKADNTTLSLLDKSNNPVSFADFVGRTLADKKMLAVTDEPQVATTAPTIVEVAKPTSRTAARYASDVERAINDLTD